ncbi:MAG: polysaccharide biosynthesis tyrosine autokinase [Proteobacteria bacterium]|nr:polysaccharide biosynthesis tyrosine autokinase [Pseudomonadota bacterium]
MQDKQQEYYQQENVGTEDSIHILDYIQLLWFRRHLIVAITLFVAVIGFIQVNQLKSIYTANATLLIGVTKSQVVDIEQVLSRDYRGYESIEEVEVLRSRSLAAKVINKLNLLGHEEFNPSLRKPEKGFFDFLKYLNPKRWIPSSWKKSVKEAISGEVQHIAPNQEEIDQRLMATATDIFLSKLSAEPIEWSNVIAIGFNSLSPVMAARVANQVPESYILDQLQAKFDATEKATAWLTDQLAELETQVAESEGAVEYYRQEHGITKSKGSGILTEQLSEVNSQLIVSRAERAASEARLLQIKRLQSSGGHGIETANEVLSSPLIQQLRGQEAQVNRRLSELSIEYGAKHPKMLQVNAEIADIQQRIESEIAKIIQGLENEVEVARTKERSLENSLRTATKQSNVQDRESVQLRALEREASANRVLYETFLNRFKETSSTRGIEASDARVISAAEVPSGASYPNKKRSFMMILILGFMGSCGLVFALHFMSPGLHSPEQIESELGIHAIGMIPRLPGKAMPYDYLMEKPHSGFVEAINSLKISLKLSDPDARINAVQVTSSVPEEGKSSLVLGLAIVMAREGKKVLVVDADLRRSSINKRLGLPTEGVGLTDYLLTVDSPLEGFVFHHEDTGVDFMRTGDAKYANATDIFTSKRMHDIVAKLKQEYDFVLFDTPPVMAVADAKVIGQIMDKTLFVVRWDKTPRKVARAALTQLHKSNVEIAGIVLQQVDLKRYGRIGYGDSGYYYHYGRYGQYYQS